MWEIAVQLAVAGDVYDGVFMCCPFSHEMSRMRSWTSFSMFLRVFLALLSLVKETRKVAGTEVRRLRWMKVLNYLVPLKKSLYICETETFRPTRPLM